MVNWGQETVMITGGSKGIGFAIAERLGKLGAKIGLCARDEVALREAEEKLNDQTIDVFAMQADVAQEADVDRWFQATEERLGPASILVNNAGISGRGNLMELTEEAWGQTFSVNCRGVFLCTRRALPKMIEKKRGRIFMTSSIASHYYRQGQSLYFATKWALNGFSHCLAKEVNKHNIHVHLICPGMTETRFFDNMGGRPHPQEKHYAEPDVYAKLVEDICLLPGNLDTLEFSIFPNWQLQNFGIRR